MDRLIGAGEYIKMRRDKKRGSKEELMNLEIKIIDKMEVKMVSIA